MPAVACPALPPAPAVPRRSSGHGGGGGDAGLPRRCPRLPAAAAAAPTTLRGGGEEMRPGSRNTTAPPLRWQRHAHRPHGCHRAAAGGLPPSEGSGRGADAVPSGLPEAHPNIDPMAWGVCIPVRYRPYLRGGIAPRPTPPRSPAHGAAGLPPAAAQALFPCPGWLRGQAPRQPYGTRPGWERGRSPRPCGQRGFAQGLGGAAGHHGAPRNVSGPCWPGGPAPAQGGSLGTAGSGCRRAGGMGRGLRGGTLFWGGTLFLGGHPYFGEAPYFFGDTPFLWGQPPARPA